MVVKQGSGIDIDNMQRFLNGPPMIYSIDELFSLVLNSTPNTHFFITYNNIRFQTNRLFTPKIKLFRKFYIENAKFLGQNVHFIEVTNKYLASMLGMADGNIHHLVKNDDMYDTQGQEISFYNQNLVRNTHKHNFDQKYANDIKDGVDVDEFMYKHHFEEFRDDFNQFVKH